MAGRLKYGIRYRYPHMIKEEIEVWEKFMILYPGKFETVDYDFRVGAGADIPIDTPENMTRMAKMLSQKRIDVLAWVGDSPTIIEIKGRVGLSALGQILGYKTLFKKYFKNIQDPELLIICAEISKDDKDVLEENNIPVEVV